MPIRFQLSSAADTRALAPRRGRDFDLRACFHGLGKVDATSAPRSLSPCSHSSMNFWRKASAKEEDSEVSTKEMSFCSSFSYAFCESKSDVMDDLYHVV